MHNLDLATFRKVMPKGMNGSVNQELVDTVNGLFSDDQLKETYRDNLMSYASVMHDGKFKVSSYVDAVRYISCKAFSATNLEAFAKTFPDRYKGFLTRGTSDKDISSYVSAYNKNKLVNLVREQSLIAPYIYNADIFQKAINVQARLMVDEDVSPKVRSDAANSVLTHLKPPEVGKITLDITHKQEGAVDALRIVTEKLRETQKIALQAGFSSIEDIANSTIVEGTCDDVS